MRLPQFISLNMEGILQDFEDFARDYTDAGEDMDVEDLRDHAAQMLEAMVTDLGERQSTTEKEAKSKGGASSAEKSPDTAAERHGFDRAKSAFTLNETAAEFRALRASVLRQWERYEERKRDAEDDHDQGRFHEAVDQALAESLKGYASKLEHYQRAQEQTRITEGIGRARSDLLQMVSHELRTPLNSIVGYLELLATGVYGPLTEAQESALARTRKTTKHLGGIIHGILDLRANAEDVPLAVEMRTVAEAVDGVDSIVRPIAKSNGVKFEINLPQNGGPVWVHRGKFRQILLNLITNALHYTPRGGRVWLDYEETPAEGCFRVHDSGPGIPQDQLEAIFEPFAQLDMSLTREHGGIGLGLTISRQLAHRMGGRITVTSEIGTGSTFTVALHRALS